jgi:hypothetical protein
MSSTQSLLAYCRKEDFKVKFQKRKEFFSKNESRLTEIKLK